MSNSIPTPARGSEAADGSHLTVEDAGSTTNPADLFHNDTTAGSPAPSASGTARDDETMSQRVGQTVDDESDSRATAPAVSVTGPDSPSTPSAPGAPEAPSAPTGGLAALAGDDSIAHVFDQTNGIIEGIDGDSDGTADSDVRSGAERADENPAFEAFADTEVARAGDTDDERTTGN